MKRIFVQKQSINKLANIFHSIDKNQDGNIDQDEIKQGAEAIMDKSGMTHRDTKDLFNSLVDNKNGLIEYSEFMTALMTRVLSLH